MSSLTLFPSDAEERLGFSVLRQRLLEHARTPYGRERLEALRPTTDLATVTERLARAGEATSIVQSGDPLPLTSAPDLRPTLARLSPKNALLDGDELAEVASALVATRRVHDGLHARKDEAPSLWQVAQRITVLKALEDRIGRTVDEQGRVRDDASPELARLTRVIYKRQSQLRSTLQSALRAAIKEGWATEDQPTIRGGRAVIPVRAEAKRKVKGFVHDVSSTGQTVYIEPASVLDLGNEVRELEIDRDREIRRILQEISAHVRHHRPDIDSSLKALGHLDALISIGRLSAELGALVPDVGEDGLLRLVHARNPVLTLHLNREAVRERLSGDPPEPRTVVPLDLTLGEADGDELATTTVVITGPNAGGKSVAMKTVGVLCLMAACGLPVPAGPGTRLPLLTQLFLDVGDQQSIQDDLSTFTSHLVNVQQMLHHADDRSLCLIDEAGTGTDPAEGGALAESILKRLTLRRALTVATTHVGALKAFAHNTPGVENGSMEFDRATLRPTYRFRAGIPGSSYAFEIAERVGIGAPVLNNARQLVGEGKERLEDLIAEFEARTVEAEKRRDEAEARLVDAERIREDYEARLARLRADADRRRLEALAEADRILQDANATVENTVREIKEAQAETEETKAARKKLEDAKQAVARRTRNVSKRQKRRQPVASAPSPPIARGPLEVGDQVRIDGAETVGELIELDDREGVVAFGSLTSRVKRNRLMKVGGAQPQRVDVRAPRAETGGARTVAAIHAQRRIDVRGERVEPALAAVQRLVDGGLAAGIPSVEILHGKGTGALRDAIHTQLASRSDIVGFDVAAWNQGGDGVTLVALA
ncbi:MAG: Smr/MutS family protein [Bacteroidota bacterium]